MKLTASLGLVLTLTVTVNTTIHVGGVEIEIPSPPGFVAVTPEMPTLYDLQKHFVAPGNEEFVGFVAEEGAPAARRGEVPDMMRRFSVQTAKSLKLTMFSEEEFQELSSIVRTENAALIEAVEEEIPAATEQVNRGVKDDYDVDLALEITQMLPLPVHDFSRRTLAYSAYAKYSVNDENGRPAPFVATLTATFVHVEGKVLFLYCYGGEDDLEWTRDISKAWAEAILASNTGGRT